MLRAQHRHHLFLIMWDFIVKTYCFYNVIKSLFCSVMRKTALLNPNSHYISIRLYELNVTSKEAVMAEPYRPQQDRSCIRSYYDVCFGAFFEAFCLFC